MIFHSALQALLALGEPTRMLALLAGIVIGLVLGVIPGLGGVVGLSLLVPFTYKMDAESSFALLLGMAAVTTVTDLIPAILFGVPGSVGAAATTLDGHALAKKGQAGRALGAGYTSALLGGVMGAVLLALMIPVIRPFILFIGSPELLAFSIFGLSMVAILSGKTPLKGFAGTGLGIMLAMIGSSGPDGSLRWTFNSLYLYDGLPLVPFTLGLFAMPELVEMAILRTSIARTQGKVDFSVAAQWQGARDALKNWWLVLRCGWLGTILGTVPGLGAASIDWIAYGHAIRMEKNTGDFGNGDIRGVIAPEASNNAKEGGHLLTTIAFGVPSGASMAILLSAFLIHGLVPGPDMLTKNLNITFLIIWSLTLAHIIGALICLPASGLFARIASVQPGKLVPIILAVIFLSAFQGSQNSGDLYALVLIGIAGWAMKALDWPRPPIMLGFVLGGVFERNLSITTQLYGWDWLTRPVVLGILALTLWMVQAPLRKTAIEFVATLRASRGALRISIKPAIVFNIAIVVVTAIALWQTNPWPLADRLVPRTAAYVVIFFGTLNLISEFFFAGAPSTAESSADRYDRLAIRRCLAHFFWVILFLVVTYGGGLLVACLVTIMLHSRFEYNEGWGRSAVSAFTVSFIAWLLFDRIFSLGCPPSLLGQLFPALHGAFDFI